MKFFVDFAFLPAVYLNKFERMLRKYEQGSLPGQQVSVGTLTKRNKKSRVSSKIEMPINLLKLHLKVGEDVRIELIDGLLEGEISFLEYSARLETASLLSDVKSQAEKITKGSFADLKSKNLAEVSDEALSQFCGAKSSPDGGNLAYKKLVHHIKKFSSTNSPLESLHDDDNSTACVVADQMNVIDLGNKMQEFKVVIVSVDSKKGASFSAKYEYALLEVIKRNKEMIGIMIDSNEKKLRQTITKAFLTDENMVTDFVLFKRSKVVIIDGFKKEHIPVAVFGSSLAFQLTEIRSIHNTSVEKGLSFLISDLTCSADKVLYVFSNSDQGMDIDKLGCLKKRNVSVIYLAEKDLLKSLKIG